MQKALLFSCMEYAMNSALLISRHNQTCDTIRAALPAECNIDQVNNPTKAMHLAHNNSYDIISDMERRAY